MVMKTYHCLRPAESFLQCLEGGGACWRAAEEQVQRSYPPVFNIKRGKFMIILWLGHSVLLLWNLLTYCCGKNKKKLKQPKNENDVTNSLGLYQRKLVSIWTKIIYSSRKQLH